MPTYEYRCTACTREWEEEQSVKEPARSDCPHCGGKTAERLISRGTTFVLKGDGWAASGYTKPTS